jgi:hypothetical protein
MEHAVLTARVSKKVKSLADKWCKTQGLVLARFIEDAIIDKLEESHDISEIETLRREPTRPFSEVMKELKGLKR